MLDLTFRGIGYDLIKWFGALHIGAANLFTFAARIFLQRDLREVRGQVIILVLGPAFEGMVVALIAIESRGQEKMGGVFHRLGRSAENFPISGRRIVFSRAGRGENFASELVVRSIGFNLVTNPGTEQF